MKTKALNKLIRFANKLGGEEGIELAILVSEMMDEHMDNINELNNNDNI